eukprot:859470-Rhodomonas_salina.3
MESGHSAVLLRASRVSALSERRRVYSLWGGRATSSRVSASVEAGAGAIDRCTAAKDGGRG